VLDRFPKFYYGGGECSNNPQQLSPSLEALMSPRGVIPKHLSPAEALFDYLLA
jgi:hypothetical protein